MLCCLSDPNKEFKACTRQILAWTKIFSNLAMTASSFISNESVYNKRRVLSHQLMSKAAILGVICFFVGFWRC